MRQAVLLTMLLCALLGCTATQVHAAARELTMTHFPVFRRELLQSQLDLAYGELTGQWGAPVRQLVLNNVCDNWRALQNKNYPVQSIPGHWLSRARQEGYTLLIGVIHDPPNVLLLTRTRTDEQLKSLLLQQPIATPDRLSAVTSVGRHYLATKFNIGDSELKLAAMQYGDMPLLALIQGRYQAALAARHVYERMQPSLKQDIRVIGVPSPPLFAAMVVNPAALAPADIERLRKLLLDINIRMQREGVRDVRYVAPDKLSVSDLNNLPVDTSNCSLAPQ